MLATIQKGLPFDVATGGAFPQVMPAPYRVIYDTTAPEQYGNVYPSWSSVMTCIALFSGPVEIYIRNGSQIPTSSGTFTSPYSMPTSWVLSTDSQGTTVPNGVYFSNSPLELKTDCNALLVFQESSGGATFTLSNPLTLISGCVIHLGAGNGTLINGASNQALLLRNVVVDTSGSGTLATGSNNVVTLLEQTVLQNNVLPASMEIYYDPTSHVNSQNGNLGVALAPGGGGSTDASVVTYEPGTPGDWPSPPTEVAQALDELATTVASLGTPTTLIYDPAGSGDQAGSYTTFTALQAAITAADMAYVVIVMLGDPEVGDYDVATNWEMVIGAASVTLPDEIYFENSPFRIRSASPYNSSELVSNSTDFVFLEAYGMVLDGVVATSPSHPMFKPNGFHYGDFYCTLLNGAVLGDGTNPVIGADDAGFDVYLNVYQQSTIESNALTTCNFTVKYDAGSTVSSTQPGTNTLNITPLAGGGGSVDASAVTYEPADSAAWPYVPDQVAQALDGLIGLLEGVSIALGSGSITEGDGGAIAIGNGCTANGGAQGGCAIGQECIVNDDGDVAIGLFAYCQGGGNGGGNVSIGNQCIALNSGIAIGLYSYANGNGAIALGASQATGTGAVCLGAGGSAANQAAFVTGVNSNSSMIGERVHGVDNNGTNHYESRYVLIGCGSGSEPLVLSDGSFFTLPYVNTAYSIDVKVTATDGTDSSTFMQTVNVFVNGSGDATINAVSTLQQFGTAGGFDWSMSYSTSGSQFIVTISGNPTCVGKLTYEPLQV